MSTYSPVGFCRWSQGIWPCSTRTCCRQHDTLLYVRRIAGCGHSMLGTGLEEGTGEGGKGGNEWCIPLLPDSHTLTHSQVRYQAATVNANEIANGVLSCLVAITSSCPILEYYEACLVGGTDACTKANPALQHVPIIFVLASDLCVG